MATCKAWTKVEDATLVLLKKAGEFDVTAGGKARPLSLEDRLRKVAKDFDRSPVAVVTRLRHLGYNTTGLWNAARAIPKGTEANVEPVVDYSAVVSASHELRVSLTEISPEVEAMIRDAAATTRRVGDEGLQPSQQKIAAMQLGGYGREPAPYNRGITEVGDMTPKRGPSLWAKFWAFMTKPRGLKA